MSFNNTLKSALVANALLLGGIGLAPAQAPVPVIDLHAGPNNAITDVPGILVGHSTRKDAQTGITALIFPEGTLMGMSPSGGAPGTRLGALLTVQHQDAQRVVMHGLTLSGGGIYGLDTACGVVKFLDEKGWTFGGRAHVPGSPGRKRVGSFEPQIRHADIQSMEIKPRYLAKSVPTMDGGTTRRLRPMNQRWYRRLN